MSSLTRSLRAAAFVVVAALGGCGYVAAPPDPIRYQTSPASMGQCKRLGAVGFTRSDGAGPYRFSDLTTPVFGRPRLGDVAHPIPQGEILGPNFAVTLEVMRDAALSLGATDLLLSRRIYRDWSYVAGTAYRCPR